MLTARGEEGDRVRGLDSGADDYVVKPFSPQRTDRAAARRDPPRPPGRGRGDLALCRHRRSICAAHRVTRAGKPVHLGPTEFRLLRFLMERPGRVFSREQLLDAVWGRDAEVELRTVDVHIRRLRKALNGDGPRRSRAHRARRRLLARRGRGRLAFKNCRQAANGRGLVPRLRLMRAQGKLAVWVSRKPPA